MAFRIPFFFCHSTICDTTSEIPGNGAISGLGSLPLFGPVHHAHATWEASSCSVELEISWHRWTEMGRVRIFCSEAFLSSEVRHERSCRGGHQLLPPKVCRSLWILFDAVLHLLQVNHANNVVKFLREVQGNQVMKRIFFLSILKHRLGQIHLQLSFLSCHDTDKIENTGTHPYCRCWCNACFIWFHLY